MGCTSEKSISGSKIHRNHAILENERLNQPKEENIIPNQKESNKEHPDDDIESNKENNNPNNMKNSGTKEENKNNLNDEEEKEENEEVKEEEEKDEEEEEEIEEEGENRDMIRQLLPYLQTKVNPNFNFPEVKDNTYVGKGLRRMKGYISIVPKDELEKKRIAFWGTRVEGDSQVWTFLKELCDLPEGEEENMKAMLEANEITPLKQCINVTYDRNGEVYEIPNYCINEPVSFDLPEMHVEKPEKKSVNFHVRKGIKQINIKAFNTTSVKKTKNNIAKKLEIDENKIRLFYRGKEMKNGNELWQYNIEDDCVVIMM